MAKKASRCRLLLQAMGNLGSDGVKRNKHANGKQLLGEFIQQMPEKIAV